MLRQIRGSMKRVVVWIFVIPLIVAFAAWGVPEMRQLTRTDAVRVGRTGIQASEIQREFDRYATNQRLQNPAGFDREAAIASGVPNQIVQALASRAALDNEMKKLGLSMSREAVREFLTTNEQFKNPRTGKFDQEALSEILRQYNYGVAEFEDRLQSDLLRNQLMAAIGPGGSAPKAFVDALILRETETRRVNYLTVSPDLLGAAPEATPERLKEYYEANGAQFMAPEYRKFTAVVLKDSDYAGGEGVSEDELKAAYEAGLAKYQTPERRTVYQLTFETAEEADAAIEKLKAGVTFESIADSEGKSLPQVTLTDALKSDILDPKVADAAFKAVGEGATVGPVKGVFGFTIAQIAGISPASTRPFEEVRAELETELTSKNSKKDLFNAIEEIENARDTGATLSDAAAKAGVIAIEYGPVDSYSFGSAGEIVAGLPGDVLKEAFTIEEGEESDATELADKSGYFFVAVTEVTPPAKIPFEKVADEVRTRWEKSDRDSRIASAVKQIREEIAKGKSLKDAAAAFNRAPLEVTVTRRAGAEAFSASMLDQIFSAPVGEPVSGPSAAGDAQIIATVGEISFDTAQVTPDNAAMFGQYIGGQIGQELVEAYAAAVTADASVKVSQNQIDTLFATGQ